MSEARRRFRRRWAIRTAAPMFWISVLFLANTATSIVLWVDVPRVTEAYLQRGFASGDSDAAEARLQVATSLDHRARQLGGFTLILALVLWPVFLCEFLFYFFSTVDGRRFTKMGLLACFCPPLRLGAPNLEMRERIWLPKFGWTRPTSKVRQQLEMHFSAPMIGIALMILPILLVEFGLQEHAVERSWLRITLHASTGTIWFAFAFEFIVLCSMARRKLHYCRVHWLDLVIIMLPLLSFMRSLRVLRATRLGRLAKVQHLTKIGRVYRLRGLAIKVFRGLAVFEVINRLLPMSPERQIELLSEKLAENEAESRVIRRKIASLEQLLASREREASQSEPAE